MEKIINISGVEYKMKSSAFTPFKYKNDYNRDLLKDINVIVKIEQKVSKLPKEEQDTAWLDEFGSIFEIITKIAYVMIKEADKSFKPYEDWLGDIESLYDDNNWIGEVLGLILNTFQGRSKGNK
jgi:hypothetical protein